MYEARFVQSFVHDFVQLGYMYNLTIVVRSYSIYFNHFILSI
jgi:hypothetical protein